MEFSALQSALLGVGGRGRGALAGEETASSVSSSEILLGEDGLPQAVVPRQPQSLFEDNTEPIAAILNDVVYAPTVDASQDQYEIPEITQAMPPSTRRLSSVETYQYDPDGTYHSSNRRGGSGSSSNASKNSKERQQQRLQQQVQKLQRQLEEYKLRNDQLQRSLHLERQEFAYQKASWTDQWLDLHAMWDAKLLEHKRKTEQKSNAMLEQELEQLILQSTTLFSQQQKEQPTTTSEEAEERKAQADVAPEYTTSTTTTTSNQQQQHQNPDDLSTLHKQQQQEQQQQFELKIQQHKKEKSEWEQERTQLQETIQQTQYELMEANTKVQWLEHELGTQYLSDSTDSDDDDDSDDDSSDDDDSSPSGGGKKTKLPLAYQQRLEQVMEQNRTFIEQQLQDRDIKIQELQHSLEELQQEKDMEEAMQSRQLHELSQKYKYQQERLQRSERSLLAEQQRRNEEYTEMSRRIETLEVENYQLIQSKNTWESKYQHTTSLLKQQIASLEASLHKSNIREEESAQRELTMKQRLSYQTTSSSSGSRRHVAEEQDGGTKSNNNHNDDVLEQLMAKVETLESQLTQAKGREAVLDQSLADQIKVTEEAKQELEAAQERIAVLQTYINN
eukprot:scaffold260_cov115-Cylindrotheca_fusiformis.AAC.1